MFIRSATSSIYSLFPISNFPECSSNLIAGTSFWNKGRINFNPLKKFERISSSCLKRATLQYKQKGAPFGCPFLKYFKWILSFHVQPFLFGYQFIFGFAYVFIINAAIHRTNSSTLRFIMKTNTLGTLIRNDVVNII